MPLKLAARVDRVADSITLAVTAKARQLKLAGVDVVGFGAGEPDFDTPDFLKDAAKKALDAGQTKYTPSPCVPELRAAVCAKLKRDNKLTYEPAQVTVSAGGKGCLYHAMLALLDEGDEVLIPAPYWVSYPEQAKLCGATPTFVEGAQANGFKVTPQQLEAALTERTRVFVFNSPSNPAGHGYTADEQRALGEVLKKFPNVVVFSDEIYEKLVYDGFEFASFAAVNPDLHDRTVTFNCHSKSFAMTGWRLGYAAGPADLIAAMNKLQSQTISHVTSFCQEPAALALTDARANESVEQMRRDFERRGRHMWQRLGALPGVTCVRPVGAFYCFPDVSATFGKKTPKGTALTDGVSFAAALLDEAHVAVVPGNDSGFATHVRLSFATSMRNIDKGLDRVDAFLKALA